MFTNYPDCELGSPEEKELVLDHIIFDGSSKERSSPPNDVSEEQFLLGNPSHSIYRNKNRKIQVLELAKTSGRVLQITEHFVRFENDQRLLLRGLEVYKEEQPH